jgi:hypothetical protein
MRKIIQALLSISVVAMAGLPLQAAHAASPLVEPTAIPVLTWHELNNGCLPSAIICNAADPESVSTTQLTNQLSYLAAQGYHTVTAAQYRAWETGQAPPLPSNPVLLVADNGIYNLLSGAQSILAADGFTMSVAVVTGFADGASGTCPNPTYEPGCPVDNQNWAATWSQLSNLSPSVYNFIFEAGSAGHFVQTYVPNCTQFYACEVPGETTAAYESRVTSEISAGQDEELSKLGSRYTPGLWVVPYSDDAYTACPESSCTPQNSTGPPGWLTSWTAANFPVAFVEDSFRNGLQNERFRIDVQGWMTESEFESTLTADLAAGAFSLAPTTSPPPPAQTKGYYETASDGGVFSFSAPFSGSMAAKHLNSPIVGIATPATGQGYWEVASDGGIFTFGGAPFYGSMGGTHLNSPIVGITSTPDGQGYWEVASDGGIFTFGDARFSGSMGGSRLNSPIVGIATDPATSGYWLVAADGGVFSFSALFDGSMGGSHLNSPIVGIATSSDGQGYWLVASDGGVFSFGNAHFFGSMGGSHLNSPIVGIATDTTTGGYWFVGSDGGIFAFNAPFYGSAGGGPLNRPIVGMVAQA